MKKIYIKPTVIAIVVTAQRTILTGSPGVSISSNAATRDGAVLSRRNYSIWDDEYEYE